MVVLAGVLAYAWVAYPVLLDLVARLRDRAWRAGGHAPPVTLTVLIAARNEEKHIRARLRNLLEQDWPPERLNIWIASDASEDGTADAARDEAAGDPRVHVVESAVRQGKAGALKMLVAASRIAGQQSWNEVLVFTDANTRFAPDALRRLAEPLGDVSVGGVCGRLVFEPRTKDGTGGGADRADAGSDERSYWRWESRLKQLESRTDSCLGANGGIYAVRRECFWPDFPGNTIVDDFVIGMKVREQGKRMVFNDRAVAFEETPPAWSDEWRRRVRVGAGVFQALVLCRRCLLPRYGWFAWMFWSHKVLRWFTPHLLVASFVVAWTWGATAQVWGWTPGSVAAVGLHACILLGLFGVFAPDRGAARVLRSGWYFIFIQSAMFVGFLRFCRGGLSGAWERTRR
jgi:cellulose synthase/poly-beta-1,6-N-acetylglucosamine synthase-like glycosyltransferase